MSRGLLALLVLLAAAPAMADAPLTLEAALARAEEVSTVLRLQELSTEAAEARWLADPRAGAPSIRFGVRDIDTPTATRPNPDPAEVYVRLRLPFPRPWDLDIAATQGAATVAREDAELDALRERVHLAVTTRFHALPLLREALASTRRSTEIRAAHLALVELRRLEGMATALDWLDSEEKRRDADDRRAGRAARVEAVEAELRLLLQWPSDQPLEIVAEDRSAAAEAEPTTAARLLEGLTQRDPGVREAEAEILRAEARLHRLQLRSLPWLDWAQAGAVLRPDRPTSFQVGVALDVPIYYWSPARTRAASQELSGAKLRLREIEHRAEQRLARRVRAVGAARVGWLVEREHRDAVKEHATPMLAVADPLLKIELEARMERAEQRVLMAYIDLIQELDRLDGAAHR
jgi:outer membrane protein TolC